MEISIEQFYNIMDKGNLILLCLLMGKMNGHFLSRHTVDKVQNEK